jgi:hypothetical protein
MARMAFSAGYFEPAIAISKQCIQLQPGEFEPLLMIAQAQSELGLLSEARLSYEQLAISFPNSVKAHFSYAGFLQSIGELGLAVEQLEKTLLLDNAHCGAYLALSLLKNIKLEDPLAKAMLSLKIDLEKSKESNKADLIKLNYALGKLYSDNGIYEQASERWVSANKSQFDYCQFRVSDMKPFFQQIKYEFSQLTKPTDSLKNSSTLIPIFIVGLPRSGSTLLEQMLSSHSDIESAGEVNYIASEIAGYLQQFSQSHYPKNIAKIERKQFLNAGELYLRRLQQHFPSSRVIIDKLPANFQSIGLIRKALPNAVIIDLRRHPMAIYLSIYRNMFAANEPYFCNLEQLHEYFLLYQDLMNFWRTGHGELLIDVSYENLVAQPKQIVSNILDACGLDWQDGCLEPHLTSRQINTLSDSQVKQPIHTNSVEQWKNYRGLLQQFEKESSKYEAK